MDNESATIDWPRALVFLVRSLQDESLFLCARLDVISLASGDDRKQRDDSSRWTFRPLEAKAKLRRPNISAGPGVSIESRTMGSSLS